MKFNYILKDLKRIIMYRAKKTNTKTIANLKKTYKFLQAIPIVEYIK